MELPERIAGANARQVREMFKTLMEAETEYVWKDDAPSIVSELRARLVDSPLRFSSASCCS